MGFRVKPTITLLGEIMENIKKQFKISHCPVIKRDVNIEFHFVIVENSIVGPPHMRGCDSKTKCGVIDRQPNDYKIYKWVNCPIYNQYP